MSFGWSATDLLSLVQISFVIIDNCKDGLRSAASQVNSLKKEVEEFNVTLRQLQGHLKETGELSFLDFTQVTKTLDECSKYLEKYRLLQKDEDSPRQHDGSDNEGKPGRRNPMSKVSLKGAVMKSPKVLQYIALGGDKSIDLLVAKLSRHRQSISLYMQILGR
jgi:hypothetical protein